MREILNELVECWSTGEPAALGTVVATFGSAPRQPSAPMLVRSSGLVTASVSGGCVEGAVYELAGEVLRDGTPAPEILAHRGSGTGRPLRELSSPIHAKPQQSPSEVAIA